MTKTTSTANESHRVNGRVVAGLDWVRRCERPASPNGESPSIAVVDLFCGCGGLTLGAWEGARHHGRQLDIRLAVDHAAEPLRVFRKNLSTQWGPVRQDDVARLFAGKKGQPRTSVERYWAGRIKSAALVLAGPPCQGHSDLNNSTRRRDPRNALYLRVARAVEVLRPRVVIIENVPTVTLDKNEVVPKTASWLRSLGYHVDATLVKFGAFGLPQLRRRHILVGTLEGSFELTDVEDSGCPIPTAGQYLDGLEEEPEERTGLFYRPSRMTEVNQGRVEYLFRNDAHDLPDSKRPPCHRDKNHAYVSMYGRMHWGKPAQTLTSGFGSMGQGRYVHPTRKRLLTPHEAARLQGFPDFFDFGAAKTMTALREMIANAVPPQFTARLVSRLIERGLL